MIVKPVAKNIPKHMVHFHLPTHCQSFVDMDLIQLIQSNSFQQQLYVDVSGLHDNTLEHIAIENQWTIPF